MTKRLIISTSAVLMFALAGPAFAQSTISGTLTGGAATGSTITGTVVSPPGSGTLTGTVTAPGTGGGGGGSTGGGGGGGGGSPVTTDYCSNIDGVQPSIPTGYGIQNGVCVLLSAGGGTGTGGGGGTPGVPNTGGGTPTTPGIPNTGDGGAAAMNLFILALAAGVSVWSGFRLYRSRHAF